MAKQYLPPTYLHFRLQSQINGNVSTKTSWVRLNRLLSGIGLFLSTVHKCNMAPTAACKCGMEEQTGDSMITTCSIFHHPNMNLGLEAVDKETEIWMNNTSTVLAITFEKFFGKQQLLHTKKKQNSQFGGG